MVFLLHDEKLYVWKQTEVQEMSLQLKRAIKKAKPDELQEIIEKAYRKDNVFKTLTTKDFEEMHLCDPKSRDLF